MAAVEPNAPKKYSIDYIFGKNIKEESIDKCLAKGYGRNGNG